MGYGIDVHPPSCVCCVREQAQRGRPADRLVPPRSPSPTSCFVLRVLNRVRVVYGIIGIAKLSTGTGKPDWRQGFWSVSPQISPKGIARVPPTQLGPALAAELPRGRLKKKYRKKTRNQETRGGANLFKLWRATDLDPSQKWFSRSARCYARTIRCHLASGFPRSFGLKA